MGLVELEFSPSVLQVLREGKLLLHSIIEKEGNQGGGRFDPLDTTLYTRIVEKKLSKPI